MIPYLPSLCHSGFCISFQTNICTVGKLSFRRFSFLYVKVKHTKTLILTFLIEHCLTPKKVGWCRGSFPRWFYDPTLQQCQEFIFGGCKPNKNNYLREEECKLACRNVKGESASKISPFFLLGSGCPYGQVLHLCGWQIEV